MENISILNLSIPFSSFQEILKLSAPSNIKIPRLLLTSGASGGGKTSLSCGFARLFQRRGKTVSLFKCGPDFIDHLYHEHLAPGFTANLDLFFLEKNEMRELFSRKTKSSDIAIIEGVMGYYDGMKADSTDASSYDVADTLDAPALFICSGRGGLQSIAAHIQGFMNYRRDSKIRGVILNPCSKAQYEYLKAGLETILTIPVLGYVPYSDSYRFKEVSLGLESADSIDFDARIDSLAKVLEETVDIDTLVRVASEAAELSFEPKRVSGALNVNANATLAVAKDACFSFYYAEALDLLTQLGLTLRYFSPLKDESLPQGTAGIYLGGGYPENYASQLAENTALKHQIASYAKKGCPVLAEGGGFMYLHDCISTEQGECFEQIGLIPGYCEKGSRLQNFGYAEYEAQKEAGFFAAGMRIKGHEFHYWTSSNEGSNFIARKTWRDKQWSTMHAAQNFHAGFPHLYLLSQPSFAESFAQACSEFTYKNEQALGAEG